MIVLRPVETGDLDPLYELSGLAKAGLTSLPADRELLARKIKQSRRSFTDKPDRPGAEVYLFVAEDLEDRRIIGTSAVYAKVGGFEPFYTYRLRTTVKESKVLDVRAEIQYLELIKDHNGPAEIGTLFLSPKYRQSHTGRLLSLSRFLFMAQYPQCFEPVVIAEMRGVIDEQDRSPFWEALGKHFFRVEFKNADMMVLRDKSFIGDLMPKHPVYVCLLPPKAQAVIGQVHENTLPAMQMLKQEGFVYDGEIDIFEGGPVVRAERGLIRTVRESVEAVVSATPDSVGTKEIFLVASVNAFSTFRVCAAPLERDAGGVRIPVKVAAALGVTAGGRVRYAPIKPKR